MKTVFCLLILGVSVYDIVCPPVAPNPQPVEGDSPEEDDVGLGLEYDRYLREVVMALEEDESFRKKLEEMNVTDIKNGKIAMHLDLVSHQIRERLDEIKRQEIQRLRLLAREKMNRMNGIQKMDQFYPHHVDLKNPHSFETRDLENLIKKATSDLDEIDKKRKKEFQQYEMEKEHKKREELKQLNEEDRKKKIEELEEMKKRHEQHPPVHHPGSKAQLEEVWEKTDNMDPEDFDPKTFFKLHDINNDGVLDPDEVEALFQKELDQVYDPNMPEDDMAERYEDMARMREHVFSELDHDRDSLISIDEFLNYTHTKEFEKDEGWKTVDEQQNFTEEEFQQYEAMLRQHEEEMRRKGIDPNMVQPGVVPLGHDPNVQQMEMPHGQPPGQNGMNQQQQQQLHFQQQQQMGQMQGQGQMPGHGQVPMQGQMPNHGQIPIQGQMPMQAQMPIQGQVPGHGQVPLQGQMPEQVPIQGQVPVGQMPGQGQGQVPPMGQESNNINAAQQPPAQAKQGQHKAVEVPISGQALPVDQAQGQGHDQQQGQIQAQGHDQQQGQIQAQGHDQQQGQDQQQEPVKHEDLNQGQGQDLGVKSNTNDLGGPAGPEQVLQQQDGVPQQHFQQPINVNVNAQPQQGHPQGQGHPQQVQGQPPQAQVQHQDANRPMV